ncbi:36681_t:CDS:10 [Gigaspora margarita]|uniref:36681_t:CDS:1 n=1 Tax=Gigaspora margarita TaxID=4874 RepID=A0ABM8VYY2_GIGMA|nr:36681_t:CDS:10 [Gigaspora margarita]
MGFGVYANPSSFLLTCKRLTNDELQCIITGITTAKDIATKQVDSENPTPVGEDADAIYMNELGLLGREDLLSKTAEVTKETFNQATSPIEVVSTILEISLEFTKPTIFLLCKHVVHYDCIKDFHKMCPTCPSSETMSEIVSFANTNISDAQKKRIRESSTSTKKSSSKKAKKVSGKKVSSTLKQLIEELLIDNPIVGRSSEEMGHTTDTGIDSAESKNEDASCGLITSYFDFGEALYNRYKELKPTYGKDGARALVKSEVRKEIPEAKFSDDALKKRMERARKMFKIFNTIGKEKIARVKSIPPEKISLPTVDLVKRCETMETLIDLLSNNLQNSHLEFLSKQDINGPAFLRLNVDKLMQDGLRRGPAKNIAELIEKIKDEGQSSSQEQESLKRHIERVIKEEVGELRRIDMETEKGRVVLNGTKMNFPFSLTQTHRQNSHGKFQKPSNISLDAKPNEDEIQEYFIDECKTLKALQEIKLHVVDTHSIPLLSTRKPDFVFIQKGRPLDPLNVVAVGEIRKRTSNNFKNADIEHAVTFASESLIYNNSEPPNDGNTITTVTLVRSISIGRTSIVYEGTLENSESSVVVKKAKNAQYLHCFTNKKNVLIRLSDLNLFHLPKLLLSNDDTLVMTPLCNKVNNLQIKDIKNIIETLETVHSNFQLGYSKIQGENASFAGALECMPDNILQSLINKEQINYEPTIDLICLVQSLYLMLHQPLSIERISFDRVPENFKKRAQDILDFWGC